MKLEFTTIIFLCVFFYSAFMYELGRKAERDKLLPLIPNIEEVQTEETPSVSTNETNVLPPPQQKAKPIKTTKKVKSAANRKYAVSQNGINFIKEQEGCVLTAYWDTNGYSIGYGHHKPHVTKNMTISKEQAELYLLEDIEDVNNSINVLLKDINYQFSQNFIDGLGSLIYNCGQGGVQNSTFYTKLKNKCRWNESPSVIQKDLNYTLSFIPKTKVTCKAHTKRRKAEYNLMISM